MDTVEPPLPQIAGVADTGRIAAWVWLGVAAFSFALSVVMLHLDAFGGAMMGIGFTFIRPVGEGNGTISVCTWLQFPAAVFCFLLRRHWPARIGLAVALSAIAYWWWAYEAGLQIRGHA